MHGPQSIVKDVARRFGVAVARDTSRNWRPDLYEEQSRPDEPTYVNLGAGDFFHPMWHNVDLPNEFYRSRQRQNIHIVHDLCSRSDLPFDSRSLKLVYTSHTLEHLPDEAVAHLLNEVYRCLRSDGTFRLTCPDMELQYRAYGLVDRDFWPQPSPWGTYSATLEDRFLEHFATILTEQHADACRGVEPVMPGEFRQLFVSESKQEFFRSIVTRIPVGSNAAFPQGHCNWFTPSRLEAMLHNAGFSVVRESRFGQSADPRMRNTGLFDGTTPELSLYMECQV